MPGAGGLEIPVAAARGGQWGSDQGEVTRDTYDRAVGTTQPQATMPSTQTRTRLIHQKKTALLETDGQGTLSPELSTLGQPVWCSEPHGRKREHRGPPPPWAHAEGAVLRERGPIKD